MRWFLSLIFMVSAGLGALEKEALDKLTVGHPFNYDLDPHIEAGTENESDVMLFCHGLGGSPGYVSTLRAGMQMPHHLVAVRFPQSGATTYFLDPHTTAFGTIEELRPILFMLKRLVIDFKEERVNLYGFSAGGGAVVNSLDVLINGRFPEELETLGIGIEERRRIVAALEKGAIVLDCPLKSIEETMALQGATWHLKVMDERYTRNDFQPIETLKRLSDLNFTLFVHFQTHDEILSNRDDTLFIERLKLANSEGKTHVVIGNDRGHITYHTSLWRAYEEWLTLRTVFEATSVNERSPTPIIEN